MVPYLPPLSSVPGVDPERRNHDQYAVIVLAEYLPEQKRRGSAVLFFCPVWFNIILSWILVHSWDNLRIKAFSARTEADRCPGVHHSLDSDNIHRLRHRRSRTTSPIPSHRSRLSSCNHSLRSGTSTACCFAHSRIGSAASLVPLDRPRTITIIVARFSKHEAVLVSRAVLAPGQRLNL